MHILLRMALSKVPDIVCQGYGPENPTCKWKTKIGFKQLFFLFDGSNLKGTNDRLTYKSFVFAGKNLLPPSGTNPKGAKSSSVLSRLFSAYTGY